MFTIEFFTSLSGRSPVKDFIKDQDLQSQDKIWEVIEYLREFGFQLPTSYLRRMTGSKKLWELRAKYRSKQYRLFLAKGKTADIILLHGIIKKTAKTPRQEIKSAEQRLKIYLEEEL